MVSDSERHMILDDATILWSSDEYDAFEEGSRIMAAVDAGETDVYVPEIGSRWTGDLVLVKELSRTR